MRFSAGSLALLAALSLPIAAHADTFSGSVSFADLTNNNSVNFTGTFTNPTFTFTGGQGFVYTDGLTLTPFDNRPGNGVNGVSDSLQISFLFSLPNPTSGNLNGTGTISGHKNDETNTINWDNGGVTLISFSDGSQLRAYLPDLSFEDHDSASENLTLTVLKNGSSAPEPASLALFGTGLLGVVGAVRRRVKA